MSECTNSNKESSHRPLQLGSGAGARPGRLRRRSGAGLRARGGAGSRARGSAGSRARSGGLSLVRISHGARQGRHTLTGAIGAGASCGRITRESDIGTLI